MVAKQSPCVDAMSHLKMPFSVEIETSDLAEFSALVTQLFGHHKIKSINHSLLNATVAGRDSGGLLLGKLQLGCGMNFDVDEVRTSWIISQALVCEGAVDKQAFSPSDLMMFSPGWRGSLNLAPPGGFRNTCIPMAMMTNAMRVLLGDMPESDLEFIFRLPSDSRASQHLSRVIGLLHDGTTHIASNNFG